MNLQVINIDNPLWTQTLSQIQHDIYYLPEYVALEANRTKSIPEAILINDGDKVFFLPYLLRSCREILDADLWDIISPYGYPGILLNEAALNTPNFLQSALSEVKSFFLSQNICSAFLRLHPLLNSYLNQTSPQSDIYITGETISIDLNLSAAEIWHQTRPEYRTHINRAKRMGFTARIVKFQEYIDDFIHIYNQTMDRVKAQTSFYFDYDYYASLAQLQTKIHLGIVELEQQIACAGIFTECCGIVQYHLSGTRTEFLKYGPNKLLLDYVRLWSKERNNQVLHLGGGLGGGKDSLYHFKTGFSKQINTFLTMRMIIDENRYFQLVKLRAQDLKIEPELLLQSRFFPAYRASN